MASWYEEINKPPWAPPGWVFGVVWPVLYTIYAGIGVLIFLKARTDIPLVVLYVGGWIVNLLWIPLFRRSSSVYSPLWILVLLALTIALQVQLYRTLGGLWWALLLPYSFWLAFASSIGFGIAYLN